MKTVPVVVAAFLVGAATGHLLSLRIIRVLRRKVRELKAGTHKSPLRLLRSVTRLIFVTTQISALVWVFTSYGIAIYSTVFLQQVYTMAELSEPAIHTILGVGFLKVLENIFEHNEGAVFGRNKQEECPSSDSEGEENI